MRRRGNIKPRQAYEGRVQAIKPIAGQVAKRVIIYFPYSGTTISSDTLCATEKNPKAPLLKLLLGLAGGESKGEPLLPCCIDRSIRN